MEESKVNFTNLKRQAPGRFTEELLELLSRGIDLNPYAIEISKIELGENPFVENLDLTFFVTLPEDRKGRPFPGRKGPKLFFTFTSAISAERNLAELREFIREHAAKAAAAPREPAASAHSARSHNGD
jgi:hypothetical protein